MSKIVDPDVISQGVDVIFDTSNFTIQLLTTGAIDNTGSSATNGVTLQCIYSFALEEWNDDLSLTRFRFPFDPITAGQFELINGWTWADATTESLIRDAGWLVRDTNGNAISYYANIGTLGVFDASTDQAYFQQEIDGERQFFSFAGEVNQAIEILSDPNGDGSYTGGFDRRNYLKVFLREENKLFDSYDLIAEQSPTDEAGIVQMTYRSYSLPLSNAPDLNYIDSDANIGTTVPYTDINLTYLDGVLADNPTWTPSTDYETGDVVQGSDGRWYITGGGSSGGGGDSSDLAGGSDDGLINWTPFEGEREIGGVYSPFFVIVDANTDNLADGARIQDIYEKVQYSLRQNTDIDAGTGTVIGQTADDLLRFEGDTLITASGVYIDDFNSIDTNSITFTDALGTATQFPFIAAGSLLFNNTLQQDPASRYFLFFTNDDAGSDAGNDFNTAGATLIQDSLGGDITGLVDSNTNISFNYDYDGNGQRGSGSAGTDVPYTGIALGRGTAQYVLTQGTLTRSTANSVNFVAALERVYLNP